MATHPIFMADRLFDTDRFIAVTELPRLPHRYIEAASRGLPQARATLAEARRNARRWM